VVVVVFSFVADVNAGFFSFLADLVSDESKAAPREDRGLNSQTMALLQAEVGSLPTGGGDTDPTIVDDSAIASSIGPSGTALDMEEKPISHEISVYVVRKGDNLSSIAKMFGVSVNTILWANDMRASTLKEGQQLVILPVTGVKYKIKTGDTLKSIATRYKADIDEIVAYNELDPLAKLEVGLEIMIPDAEIVIPKATPSYSTPLRGGGGPTLAGYYMRPTTGRKTQGLHGYNGVDLASPAGSPIVASAAGTVIIVKTGGWNGGYGNYIVVKHGNGTQTLYAHNNRNLVSVGDYVSQGQSIGTVGSTGKSTGSHLHFEVRGAANPF